MSPATHRVITIVVAVLLSWLGTAAASPDQAGQERLPHDPGSEDGDGHVTSWVSTGSTGSTSWNYFLDTNECRKNVRLLGRSARRLMR